MVLRGGENVYCAEVESAIFEHDAVAECAVFGVPDDRLGEEVGAAVVVKPRTERGQRRRAARAPAPQPREVQDPPKYVWFLSTNPCRATPAASS